LLICLYDIRIITLVPKVVLFLRGCESLYLTSNYTMTTKITLKFVGSQAVVSVNEGSMRMAVYLLGRNVGNLNL